MRTRLVLPAIVFGGALCSVAPAVAQYDGGYDAPRPPGSVPVRPPGPPPQQYQQQRYYPPPQQQYYPPPAQYAPPPQYAPPGQGAPQQAMTPPARPGIQSEDLPAPGSGSFPPPAPNQQRPAAPPAVAATAPAPPPASGAAPAPAADVVTPPPPQRIANPTAVFNGLDKITGRITSFESAIGETVQFGALQVTARACYSRPPTETALTDGFVEVDEVTLQGDIRRIFTGWMFAASPGLHGVEHAVYDIWLVDCKGGARVAADSQTAASPSAAPPSRQPAPSRQGNGQQRPPQQRQPPPLPPPGLGR